MTRKALLLVVVLALSSLVVGDDPGMLFTAGGDALAGGVEVQLPGILSQKISGLEIASIAGTTRELLFLNISYNLTNIVIQSFTTESFSAEFLDHGIELTLSGISMHVTCDWEYDDQSLFFIHISDSGTATMESDEGSYEIKLLLKEHNGVPEVSLNKNKLNLKHFHLDLDGGADWFYDLFDFIITPLVKDEIEDVVEDIIQSIADDANSLIDAVPLPFPLPANIAFNWGMTDDLYTDDDGWGTLPIAAVFEPAASPDADPPFVLEDLPSQVSNQTFQAVLSQFTAESLGWALWDAGSLNITIPLGTTNDFRLLIPSLYRAFPDAPLEVTVACLAYPIIDFSSVNGMEISAAPYMYWNVQQANGTETNAFTLILETQAQLQLAFNGTELHGHLAVPTLELILQDTKIGDFSLFSLNAAIQTVVNVVLVPAVNAVLGAGLPSPVIAGFTFANPTIGFVDNSYAYFSSAFTVAAASGSPTAVAPSFAEWVVQLWKTNSGRLPEEMAPFATAIASAWP